MTAPSPSRTSLNDPQPACRSWRLVGGRVALGPNESIAADVEILDGHIVRIGPGDSSAPAIDASGLLLLPGLINAHDHLEFALFPRLGTGPYPNAQAWAENIYHPNESPIREHLTVPKAERLLWGGIRNLLSGVTTVAHHNPYEPVFEDVFPVRVMRRYGWAHSPALATDLQQRFQQTADDEPFFLHLGEGTDEESRQEVYRLDELGALGPRTVLIHAVALGADELKLVESRGASIVFCPSSNLFLLGRTLRREVWDTAVPVALGIDSSLTNEHCLLDELRVAQHETGLPPEKLFEMVTSMAARVLQLGDGEGALSEGAVANVLLIPDHGGAPSESLLQATTADVKMVIVEGAVHLLEGAAIDRLATGPPPGLTPFEIAGRDLYLPGAGLELGQVDLPGFGEVRRLPRAL